MRQGRLPAAAILRDVRAVVDHKLYWTGTGEDEARYLEAILNSETARSQVAGRQSRGQWGARDFDKLMLDLPIPRFDPSEALHAELVAAAARAEAVAAALSVPGDLGFIRARTLIRQGLIRDGIAGSIETLVAALLGPPRSIVSTTP